MDHPASRTPSPVWRTPEFAPFFRRAVALITALEREVRWRSGDRGPMHRLIVQACQMSTPPYDQGGPEEPATRGSTHSE